MGDIQQFIFQLIKQLEFKQQPEQLQLVAEQFEQQLIELRKKILDRIRITG